jgi:ribonuclease J
MRFCIHRAASQVGGNCIEVEAGGHSILLDLGLPLGAEKASPALLPSVLGIDGSQRGNVLAVVLSHPHQDHYGLLVCANPDWTVYVAAGAERLLRAAAFFTSAAEIPQRVVPYGPRSPFLVGPFTITAFPVDHSAYEAYCLLIEADGKRLLYSGDFRLHGRKSRVMDALLRDPPKDVDVLLMEGTVIGREDAALRSSEALLEADIVRTVSSLRGLVLASFSPQNIDRLVTFFRAALRSRRTLVVDAYTAHVLDALGLDSLPSARTSGRMRVFLPRSQKLRVLRTGRFDLIEPYRRRRIYASELNANPGRWLCLFRASMCSDFDELTCLRGAVLLYSLWPGYLRKAERLRNWVRRHGIDLQVKHTSGHAYTPDLMRFAESIAPRRLVPIHSSHPERYGSLFRNVILVPDGVWSEM